MTPNPFGTASRILVCLRYGIGDLVMELPALAALRAAAPRARISALGAHPALELLDGEGCVDERASVQGFGFRYWSDPGDEAARAAARQWIDAVAPELVLDPSHAVFGVRDLLWARGDAQLRDTGRELQTRMLLAGARGARAVSRAVREGWGLEVDPQATPRLALGAAEHGFAEHYLAEAGWGGAPLAALSPVASSPLKRWPEAGFAALGRMLVGRGHRLLVFAGPDHEEEGRRLVAQLGADVARAVPALHLRRIAALLARCRMFVCNDTGLMHMAAAVGTPVLALFGPTSPDIYAPEDALAVGGRDPDCLCRKRTEFGPPQCVAEGRCRRGSPSCIERVPVEEALAAAGALLD